MLLMLRGLRRFNYLVFNWGDSMKVSEALNKPSNLAELAGKDDRKVTDSKESNFQSKLKQVENRNYDEGIKELASKIVEQGNKLAKKIDIREFTIYKKLISEFLDEAVDKSHKFSRQSFLDRRGRHKVYAVVKKINEELDALAKEVLNDERNNINVLQSLDDIRGLILDIIM